MDAAPFLTGREVEFMPVLRSFLGQGACRQRIYLGDMEVYLRRGARVVDFKVDRILAVDALVIADVTVRDKGKGTFTAFVNAAEKLATEPGMPRVVMLENVLNKRLAFWAGRRGYVATGSDWLGAPTLFKTIDKEIR